MIGKVIVFCEFCARFRVNKAYQIYMYMSNYQRRFVLAQIELITPIMEVEIGEIIGLLHALKWLEELYTSIVISILRLIVNG
jgi:hypothetical protein